MKRSTKINIELEISTVNEWEDDYSPELSEVIQRDIHKAIDRRMRRWNFWSPIRMKIEKLTSIITTTP